MKNLFIIFIPFLLLYSFNANSQDTVVKVNGERIPAKVFEIGIDIISYKKTELKDSPTFNEYKKDISYIRFANGQRQDFTVKDLKTSDFGSPSNSSTSNSTSSNSSSSQSTITTSTDKQKPLYHVERIGTKYFINGEKVKRKEAEGLMKKSNNPLVSLTLKSAKAMRISQKIINITSYPAIPAGIIGFGVSLSNTIKASKDEGVSFKNWLALGSSFIGTLSFPITNKILKKKTNKLTDKAIDIYNLNN